MALQARLRKLEKALASACPGCRGAPAALLLFDDGNPAPAAKCVACSAVIPVFRLRDPYATPEAPRRKSP